MPALQVRDFPEDVYQRLKEQAKLDRRSLSQEVIYFIVKGLDARDETYVKGGDRVFRETRASWLRELEEDPEERERRARKRKELFARINAGGPVGSQDDPIDTARLVREGRAERDRQIIESLSFISDEDKRAMYAELDAYVRGE